MVITSPDTALNAWLVINWPGSEFFFGSITLFASHYQIMYSRRLVSSHFTELIGSLDCFIRPTRAKPNIHVDKNSICNHNMLTWFIYGSISWNFFAIIRPKSVIYIYIHIYQKSEPSSVCYLIQEYRNRMCLLSSFENKNKGLRNLQRNSKSNILHHPISFHHFRIEFVWFC